jgi:hypothetical protein
MLANHFVYVSLVREVLLLVLPSNIYSLQFIFMVLLYLNRIL